MSTAETLLGLLAVGARHGYELKRAHDGHFPQARPLAFGQVYATLARLVRDGEVEVAEVRSGAGPDRTVYSPTPAGLDRLRRWLSTPEPPSPYVANVLMAKVVTALVSGGSGRDCLRIQRAAHLARMRELTALKADPAGSVAQTLSADYAIVHLDADLRWMDTTAQRLGELAKEVRS
ncbi:MAG TPA: PadR family transcriptional regulator [Mycobacteriales bacterium]|nr:PadR family transcriptional regulator [Mycobacteriales bacterium]